MFPLEPKQLLLVAEVPGRGGGDAAERKGATGKNTKKKTQKNKLKIKTSTPYKKIKNGEENSRKCRQQCLQHTRESPKRSDERKRRTSAQQQQQKCLVHSSSGRHFDMYCHGNTTRCRKQAAVVTDRVASSSWRVGSTRRPLQHLDTTRERQTDRQRGKAPVKWLSHLSVYSQK